MLPHPAHSTSVTQNCTSFLNPPYVVYVLVRAYYFMSRPVSALYSETPILRAGKPAIAA
jgi:hypothetical protein